MSVQRIDSILYRGRDNTVNFKLFGDYTNKKLYYTVKPSTLETAVRYVDKKNESAGGAADEITATKSGDFTEFEIAVEDSLTTGKSETKLFHDLMYKDASGKTSNIMQGEVSLIHTVRSEFDNTSIPSSEYVNQNYDRSLILNVSSTGNVTKLQDHGYNVTVTGERLSEGMYKLTFDSGILSADGKTVLQRPTAYGVNNDPAILVFSPHFSTNLGYSSTELLIAVVNENDNAVMDTNFTFGINRVRT